MVSNQVSFSEVQKSHTSPVEAVAEFRRHRPDVTLMGVRLPGANGVDALISLRGEAPQARVIILSTAETDGEIQRAVRAGTSAYIFKSAPKDEMLGVIRSVHSGKRHVPSAVAARLAEHLGEEDLTARELDVLGLIRDGHRNQQIADRLGIAETRSHHDFPPPTAIIVLDLSSR